MKTRNIIYAVVLLMAGTMAGCRQTATKAAHDHDESLQLTSYNEDFEVYAEITPLVKGEASDIVAHFTWLNNFKPIEKGTVTATLTIAGETVSQTLDAPTRQGIYKFSLTPKKAGKGTLSFSLDSPSPGPSLVGRGVVTFNIEVYTCRSDYSPPSQGGAWGWGYCGIHQGNELEGLLLH